LHVFANHKRPSEATLRFFEQCDKPLSMFSHERDGIFVSGFSLFQSYHG